MIAISVGVMAHNEAGNIGRLLDRLLSQKTNNARIREIIVIASGCTDRTVDIVRRQATRVKNIRLVVEKTRNGKANAVNRFIKLAKHPILVMVSADTLPAADAVELLTVPFRDPNVGMTGGHIVPVNEPDGFVRFYVITLWKLHHEVAKRRFKGGEMIAWRNVIAQIDPDTAVDETNIEARILRKGYQVVYAADALVYNRGPETFADLLAVRRRQLVGYYQLRKHNDLRYTPATLNNMAVLALYLRLARPRRKKELLYIPGVLVLELFARMVAWYDWRIRGEHFAIWPMATTTKVLPNHIRTQ